MQSKRSAKMRKTKIICTIGPASENEEILTRMCRSGMNVARLNFSHGTHEEHQKKFDLVKQVREKLNLPIAIMLDTKGPEYRIRTFKNKKIFLNVGDKFTFTGIDLTGLTSGDTVEAVIANRIEELFPCRGRLYDIRKISDGRLSDLPEGLVERMQEMGYTVTEQRE